MIVLVIIPRNILYNSTFANEFLGPIAEAPDVELHLVLLGRRRDGERVPLQRVDRWEVHKHILSKLIAI